ncbi:hypothetical protein KI387_035318, partial [Taxus chinensis]
VFGDSTSVIHQFTSQCVSKNSLMKSYKHGVWDMIEVCDAFNIQVIPRVKNKDVDRLATIGSQYDIPQDIKKGLD